LKSVSALSVVVTMHTAAAPRAVQR